MTEVVSRTKSSEKIGSLQGRKLKTRSGGGKVFSTESNKSISKKRSWNGRAIKTRRFHKKFGKKLRKEQKKMKKPRASDWQIVPSIDRQPAPALALHWAFKKEKVDRIRIE